MGNRMSRRRVVEERMTRPQRLARQPSDVDYKKLRKLILARKLAPCFDAVELDDPSHLNTGDLEECPICFLWFPSLNRSRCCAKGICTECFLQMKPTGTVRPAQCPFCKTPCYAVEYRGARTEEEKGIELAEEQKVIEAKLRMQCEYENVGQFITADQPQFLEVRSSSSNVDGPLSGMDDCRQTSNSVTPFMGESFDADGSSVTDPRSTRRGQFALNLEEIMMMEAVWLSLQDTRFHEGDIAQTSGSCYAVPPQSGRHSSNSTDAFSKSSHEGENSSSCSLSAHNILSQQTSEPGYHRNQTDHNGGNFGESDETRPETDCFSSYSTPDVEIVAEPFGSVCRSSINILPTSNTSVRGLVCSSDDAGQSCSKFSGPIKQEESFILTMESKA